MSSDTSVTGFNQPMREAGLAYGARKVLHWDGTDKLVDFFDVKGDVEALLAPMPSTLDRKSVV